MNATLLIHKFLEKNKIESNFWTLSALQHEFSNVLQVREWVMSWVCSTLVLFWLATVLQAKPLLGFLHQPILPRTSRQFNLWSTFFLGLVAQFTQHYTHWLHTESILWSHLLCRLYFSFCCFKICIQSHLWLLLVLYTFFLIMYYTP